MVTVSENYRNEVPFIEVRWPSRVTAPGMSKPFWDLKSTAVDSLEVRHFNFCNHRRVAGSNVFWD